MSKKKKKRECHSPRSFENQNVNDSFVNFLKNPATVITNLKPNEEGIISVENLNLEAYSSLEIVVSN